MNLKIHTLKKEDRGTYYCVADNGIGKAAQRAVAVDVEFPPVVTTTAPSVGGGETRIGQALGYRYKVFWSKRKCKYSLYKLYGTAVFSNYCHFITVLS